MRHYCTYFDQRYAAYGLTLYHSLRQHGAEFRLWVLCLDEAIYQALAQLALPDLTLVTLGELERADPALLEAKQSRSRVEYYFTLTPALILFLLQHSADVELLTYLDADLFFFASPEPLWDELGSHSIAIIAHRFPPHLRQLESHGVYNVGWLTFRRDEAGLICLRWWRERCLEWCYDRVEDGRFADQKYLDDWPTRFDGVTALEHKGANVGPWNLTNHPLRRAANQIWVDDQPLVFFHFHGLKPITATLYDTHLRNFRRRLTPFVRRHIYQPYLRALRAASVELAPVLASLSGGDPLRILRPQRGGLYGFLRSAYHFLGGQYIWL
jgi:hypothetical protein